MQLKCTLVTLNRRRHLLVGQNQKQEILRMRLEEGERRHVVCLLSEEVCVCVCVASEVMVEESESE